MSFAFVYQRPISLSSVMRVEALELTVRLLGVDPNDAELEISQTQEAHAQFGFIKDSYEPI